MIKNTFQCIIKTRWLYFGVYLVLITISACAGVPTQNEVTNADYGSSMLQSDAESLATKFLRSYLKDPNSAQIDFNRINTGWIRDGLIRGGKVHYGYVLGANVNAKNSYGAYVGYKPYKFLFYNGQLISVYGQKEITVGSQSDSYMDKIY
jgi:hypothetical protein